ncbi:MAG: DUF2961 domain-containing protein [Planctomycetes bacterium]|nr:DUF2961 domain-containing protein [Planctomycetota bacterium]
MIAPMRICRCWPELAACGALLLAIAASAAAQTVTTESLLHEMTNLAGLAEFPDPPFVCKQFSSYDRASKSSEDQKTWFANGDAGQFIRGEDHGGRREHVMADMDGPGAIVRIWSANPKGTIRIYLDDAEKATIECPMTEWLGGTYPGVPKPIAGERSKGWNSYFPIAYAKHCKITSDEPGFYYHVDYRVYPPGTAVGSFGSDDVRKLAKAIEQTAATLSAPPTPPTLDQKNVLTLKDQRTKYEVEYPGPAAITGIALRLENDEQGRALRGAVLEIDFDGRPCVRAPIGDLFSCIGRTAPLATLPQTVTATGELYSRWFMPFEKGAKLRIVNHAGKPLNFSIRVDQSDYTWTERSLHFQAKWRSDWQVPTRPMIDWNYLTTSGQGQFVGVAFNIANPVKHWWGEGDEKIYVDGETFPSWFGTGTEDYYGYAWCWPVVFQHAYHSQPRVDGPGNYGITCVNRYHILDRIPFKHDFRFDMELWHWHETCKVDMAATAFWYARPGSVDQFPPIKPEDLRVPVVPPYVPPRVAGAIEGESLKILDRKGALEPQSIDGCSNEQHLWWHGDQKPGDHITLALPVEKAGAYHVRIRCLKARDYGIIQLGMNGKNLGEPIDFYGEGIKLTDEIDLGVCELNAGENPLTATVVGANEKAVKAYMFGLDYVKLDPAAKP